jgi:hypothetical protein
MPSETPQGKAYDDADLRISQIAADLKSLGFETADLTVFRRYIEAVSEVHGAIHQKIHERHLIGTLPISRMMQALNSLKTCLEIKVNRQIELESHTSSQNKTEEGHP